MRLPVSFCVATAIVLCMAASGCTSDNDNTAAAVAAAPAPALTTVNFTSWANIAPNTSVTFNAISQEMSYTRDLTGDVITALGAASASAPSTVVEDYDANTAVSRIVFTTPTSSVTWDASDPGTTITNLGGSTTLGPPGGIGLPAIDLATSNTDDAILTNPGFWNFEWQTFGVWLSSVDTGVGQIGTISFGNMTPAGSVPALGNATYMGPLGGIYVAADGQDFATTADVTLNADFANNSVAFSSTNTVLTRDFVNFVVDNTLDLNGALAITAGANTFGGTLTNQGGQLSGPASGLFFGPNAEEAGGNFSLTNPANIEALLGSFGTRQ